MTWKQKSKLQKCARKNYFRNLLRKRWTRRISRHMQPGLYHVHKERQLRRSQDLASVAWMPVLPQSSSNSRCCSMAIFVSCGVFILDLVYWSWSNWILSEYSWIFHSHCEFRLLWNVNYWVCPCIDELLIRLRWSSIQHRTGTAECRWTDSMSSWLYELFNTVFDNLYELVSCVCLCLHLCYS